MFLIAAFLLFVGCSKNKSIPGDHGTASALKNKSFFDKVGQVKPYNVNSKYAEAMNICVYADTEEKSCLVSRLPLLGISKDKITVNDILDRTMISHDFLGITFKQALLKMNPEILQMFGSVNSIIISDKITPSFYHNLSGSIYLSASYFWKNDEEFKISTTVRDIRRDYGTTLQFGKESGYIKNNKHINNIALNRIRTDDEIFFPLVKLLFHELAHANDFFPKSLYLDKNLFDLTQTYGQISYDRYINSKIVSYNQPSDLTSEKLLHLGDVLFSNVPPTSADNSLLAEDVANEFKKEIATDFYSFFSPMEDLAMNTEESLMLYYFDSYRYIVIYKYPESNFIVPEDYDYPIVWGQKARILVPAIKERALYAVENVLGSEVRKQVSEKFKKFRLVELPANIPWREVYY